MRQINTKVLQCLVLAKISWESLCVTGGGWRLGAKHFFNQRGAQVTAIDFHKETGMLVVGFSNGIFDLFEVRAMLHT